MTPRPWLHVLTSIVFSLAVSTTSSALAQSALDSLPAAPEPTAVVLAAQQSSPPTLPARLDFAASLQQSGSSSESQNSRTPQTAQPSQNPNAPSLADLGLSTQGSEKEQQLLDRRTHMLKMHQRLGLITVIPIAAACISSAGASPDHGNYANTTSRDVHVAIGATAVAMYALTASYAIRAPKVDHGPSRGGIKWHKYLIYVHAPGMVLTPILGAMAFNQIQNGQKPHGIAAAHGAVATATAISYGAAILAVSWPLHLHL